MAEPVQQPAPPVDQPQEVAAALLLQQQQQVAPPAQAPAQRQQPHSHPRLAKRLSHVISKKVKKTTKKVVMINPLRAMKERAHKKREKKNAKARQQLQSILERGWPLAGDHHDEVVQLLRKKPFLAGEAFAEAVSGHSTSPLSFLIAGGAPLAIVQEVYQHSPEAIYRAWPEDTYPPLMGACHSGVAHEVIAFLTREFPGALYKKDFDGSLPINIYMRRSPNGPSYEVIQQMVDLYPESIIVDDRIGWGLSPIDYALRLDFDIRILEYFVQRWPKEENDYGLFWDSNSDFYPDTISMERIQVLMTLLPELDYFHSFIDEWSAEGLIYVLQKLTDNTTVMDLCLRVPYRTLMADENVVETLLTLLRTNTKITKLTLLGTRGQMRQTGQVDDSYFNRVLDAIQANPGGSLQELNLSDFSLTNGERLAEFFISGAAPRILTFTDVYVANKWVAPTKTNNNTCRVEKFTISYCNIYQPWYQGFLNQLQSLKCLKEFILHNGTSLNLNVTTLLCDILHNAPLLSLKVTGYQVHMRRVAQALQTNTSLVKYSAESSVNVEWKRALIANVMEEQNTTLEWVDLPEPKSRNGTQGQRLAYYSLLNQYGRRKIRTTASAQELVGLISDVNEDTGGTLQEIAQQNILYGLLQENPAFWSGLNCSRQKEQEATKTQAQEDEPVGRDEAKEEGGDGLSAGTLMTVTTTPAGTVIYDL
ncbi:expressed unknown protein [Seminavis robusta]|uniref:Uncharacterized protein n=1 Tax=Seminavis robusta TaxID=568900 RepID=A0A9N8H8U6_9STRA|nr:expressed unknown protein [Seminavis robusta]|eukprot:Sro170_g075340.1 n/a (705) ;mRNA; r:21923-24037